MQAFSSDARHRAESGHVRTVSNTGPMSPASPTLTNPDMILPDYDDGVISLGRSQSPLMMWKNTHFSQMGFDLSPDAFTAGPIAPVTPILYGNGTMLSDIGEVTEVESAGGPNLSRSGSTRSEFTLVTSTALQYEAIKQRIKQARMAHQRNASVESASTVTAAEQPVIFADFDDTLSMDDSNFQGDDEESVADSYLEDISAQGALSTDNSSLNSADEDYSSPLSRRADLILANAKRRLSTMEGNLNRARSSLYSPVLSSLTSNSTPSPPGRPAVASNRWRDIGLRNQPNSHNRIFSESIITENKFSLSTPRASSALGTAGNYRRSLQRSPNFDHTDKNMSSSPTNHSLYGSTAFSNSSRVSLHGRDRSLEPLSEDEALDNGKVSRKEAENSGFDDYLSTMGSFSSKDMKHRSVSATQMRDLRDQVNGLRGRISSLCSQARADSLDRRSLQGFRTPSPFTHAPADQWYNDASKHEDDIAIHSGRNSQMSTHDRDSALGRVSSTAEEQEYRQSPDKSRAIRPVHAEENMESISNLENLRLTSFTPPPDAKANEADDFHDQRSEDGYESAEDGDLASESGVSAYHDSVQAQVSHEDREDAFDYEHFFLHSAMGSMTRKRMRRRSCSVNSVSSEDSIETTRGPTTIQPTGAVDTVSDLHSRRGSAGSTSTTQSFETATEGRRTQAGVNTPEEYSDDYSDEYTEQIRTLPERARTQTPQAASRVIFSPEATTSISGSKRPQSAIFHRPYSSAAIRQNRLSVQSVLTRGSRSFPLVSQPKGNMGVLTPEGSPDQELKQISDTLMHETASICEKKSIHDDEAAAPMQMLQKDDQKLVEQLVASLGRCVLGLTEAGRASPEGIAYRQKIETARRILEGTQ